MLLTASALACHVMCASMCLHLFVYLTPPILYIQRREHTAAFISNSYRGLQLFLEIYAALLFQIHIFL